MQKIVSNAYSYIFREHFCLPKCEAQSFFNALMDYENLVDIKNAHRRQSPCSSPPVNSNLDLKGHGNEADFLGFLQKAVRHRLFTLHF
jgi:hypothetical protein